MSDPESREKEPPLRRLGPFLWTTLRLEKTWRYKAPLLVTVLYVHAANGSLGFANTLSALFASLSTIVGIAGLAYLSNDFADRAIDRRAGKPNSTAALGVAGLVALILGFLIAAFAPWAFVLPFDRTSASLLLLELFLIAAYALPPLRLKERGLAGALTDALYAHAIPSILAALTYGAMSDGPLRPSRAFVAVLALWQFALGLRNIGLHQLADYGNDLRTRTRTWTVQQGPAKVESRLRYVVLPVELGLFLVLLGILTPFVPGAAPALGLHSLWVRGSRSSHPTSESGLRGLLYSYLDPFYLQWLPILILASAATQRPAFLALLLFHLMLFPDVRESARTLLSRRALSK